ncbi:TRAP transporter small permease subunit [Desertibaculum subflavum]|uniref:TRAP transporter small permease subunit n=1 Tax=Desertibaculum subflavum TaxID=2268458 RepID=UPI000E667B47
MLNIARGITRLNRWIGRTVAWIILPIFVLLIIDVAMRYLVGRPAIWTSELAQLVFGVYGVIAGGYLLAERAHVNVDIFYGKMPRKRKALVDVATSILFFMFMAVLMYQGTDLAWDSIEKLETSQSIWNPPVWPVKLMIPVAGLLLLLQGIVRLVADIRVLMGLPADDETFGAQATDEPSH